MKIQRPFGLWIWSYTKTVKHNGQPGDSSVEEWQVEQVSECHKANF